MIEANFTDGLMCDVLFSLNECMAKLSF